MNEWVRRKVDRIVIAQRDGQVNDGEDSVLWQKKFEVQVDGWWIDILRRGGVR